MSNRWAHYVPAVRNITIPTALTVLAVFAAACTGADGTSPATAPETTVAAPGESPAPAITVDEPADDGDLESPADASLVAAIEAAIAAHPPGCDPLDTRHCFLPFPSDHHTTPDAASPTGLRVAFPQAGAPSNVDGVTLDLAEWNRNDGFSPNSRLQTHLAGLDAAASNLPPWTDLEASLADNSPVVIVDVESGERVPLWAERDAKAAVGSDDDTLVIHPAVSLPPGRTFAVAIRHLVDATGATIEAGPVFVAYRDRLATEIASIESRRADMESMFQALGAAGVDREALQTAWTFTTASTQNVTGRMLHIRDETLASLDGGAPEFEITDVIDDERDGTARQIVGSFSITNWLTGDGSPGNRFHYGDADLDANPDALPAANGTVEATFVCNIPDAVLDGDAPGRLVQYGHGLLGSHFEINAGNVRAMSNEHDAVYCATKWAGMSEDDIGNAVDTLNDISNFPTMADRLQQGVLHHIVLGRLMLADDGLVSHPAFQRADGSPLIDTSRVVYDGNSQGGIMGLMLVGVSPDLERAVLGVPGMNYSMLLPRSVDFDTYEAVFVPAYPDVFERSLIISMIQMLWDRSEGAGYVHHVVSNPLPGTPTTEVLLHVAFGDWQVTELSAFIAARSMGIPIHRPVAAPGRSGEVNPGWGLADIAYPTDDVDYPYEGSAIIVWDSGSDPIPFDGVPPRTSRDSHEDPRADANVRVQKAAFMFDGVLVDVCGADQPCTAPPRS
jgi:hypothetical protein